MIITKIPKQLPVDICSLKNNLEINAINIILIGFK